MVPIDVNHDFKVWRTDPHRFVLPVSCLLLAERFHRNTSRYHVLRDEDRKRLLAAALPVVNPRQHTELIIEIIVEHRDERRVEHKILAERRCRAQVGRAFCSPTDKFDGTAGFFLSFRGPIVMEWSAVHRELELACGFDLSSAWHVRAHGAVLDPGFAGLGNLKILAADGLAVDRDPELAFVGGKDGWRARGLRGAG